jgi:hypothetical protein
MIRNLFRTDSDSSNNNDDDDDNNDENSLDEETNHTIAMLDEKNWQDRDIMISFDTLRRNDPTIL